MEAGQLIDGKYRVERILGEGGMGIVLAVTHVKLGRSLAIKILKPTALAVAGMADRFLREARAASRLKSDNVGEVIDVGELPSGEPYMVMELLEGEDLASVIRERPLTPAVAVDYLLQACEALAEAHAFGMVHRDLKPANLFLTRRRDGSPLVKVLDFGIATAAKGDVDGLTKTHSIMGSPHYMSPEQLRSAKIVDERSDIWSLGVTLYELVSMRRPFDGDSFSDLAIKIATEPHAPLQGVPAELVTIIDQCLAKDPALRFANVGAFASALAEFRANGREVANRVATALLVKPSDAITEPQKIQSRPATQPHTTMNLASGQSLSSYPDRPPPRFRLKALATVVFGAATVTVVLLLAFGGGSSQPSEEKTELLVATIPDASVSQQDATVESLTPVKRTPDRVTVLQQARARRVSNPTAALAETESLIERVPGDPEIRVLRAEILFVQGQADRALDELLAARNPKGVDVKALVPYLKKLLAGDPKNPKVQRVLVVFDINITVPIPTGTTAKKSTGNGSGSLEAVGSASDDELERRIRAAGSSQ